MVFLYPPYRLVQRQVLFMYNARYLCSCLILGEYVLQQEDVLRMVECQQC